MKNNETVFIAGNDSRGLALAYAVARSPLVGEVFIAPGNEAGSDYLTKRLRKPITSLPLLAGTVGEIMELVRKRQPDLTIASSETWLDMALGDALFAEGFAAVAPKKEVAMLELDKAWSRQVCQEWGVPQPEFHVFEDPGKAVEFIRNTWTREDGVVKVAGPVMGKGVSVCDSRSEMIAAVEAAKKKFGTAADKILIEERLRGVEVSYIALCDGENLYPLVPAMDHKRLKDGDIGPNTGGMGAIAPNPFVTPEVAKQIEEKIFLPTIRGMMSRHLDCRGIFFAGVMLVEKNGKTVAYDLEWNTRGGDPETSVQVVLENEELYLRLKESASGQLPKRINRRVEVASAVIVLASEGYPDSPQKGARVKINSSSVKPDTLLFYGGVNKDNGELVVSGGRVMQITTRGGNVARAVNLGYREIDAGIVDFKGRIYRKDIGALAMTKPK